MLLKGGVSQQEPIQGGVSSSGGDMGGMGGGTPWGMIAQAIEKKRDRTSQQLMNLGNNLTNLSMAASLWHPNFTPIAAQGYQPQNMQSNLYSYITT